MSNERGLAVKAEAYGFLLLKAYVVSGRTEDPAPTEYYYLIDSRDQRNDLEVFDCLQEVSDKLENVEGAALGHLNNDD